MAFLFHIQVFWLQSRILYSVSNGEQQREKKSVTFASVCPKKSEDAHI